MHTDEHEGIFVALDRAYGLIDGSASWPDCLTALTDMVGIEASRLLIYDCHHAQSHIVEAVGISSVKGRTADKPDIDDALWQTEPGDVWLPAKATSPHPTGLKPYGYSVLDRDSVNILYLEFLSGRSDPRQEMGSKHLLRTVLPHLHRACRLRRSVSGDDIVTFAAPALARSSPAGGLSIELRLRRRFRLSKAEARVATLLSDGLAPRMIAERLNVSIHTVRSQLQAIFHKTDTSRQAELTSLILRETDIPRAVCQTRTIDVQQGERSPCP